MDRGSDGKLQEVGQVSVSLQRASGEFQTTKLNGFEVFARFGSAIAPLGDLDQDGFSGKIRVQQLWAPHYLCPTVKSCTLICRSLCEQTSFWKGFEW